MFLGFWGFGVLLSPQHLSQVDLKNGGIKYGTGYAGHDDGLVLHWGNNQYHRHVSLNPNTNTPSFHTAPGSKIIAALLQDVWPVKLYALQSNRPSGFLQTFSIRGRMTMSTSAMNCCCRYLSPSDIKIIIITKRSWINLI